MGEKLWLPNLKVQTSIRIPAYENTVKQNTFHSCQHSHFNLTVDSAGGTTSTNKIMYTTSLSPSLQQ
jgi:hypothetical protein